MKRYNFEALDKKGDIVRGQMDAASESAILARLNDKGLLPIRTSVANDEPGLAAVPLERKPDRSPPPPPRPARRAKPQAQSPAAERKPQPRGAGMKPKDLLEFTRELSHLVKARVALDRSLGLLAQSTQNPRLRHSAGQIADQLREGQTFSDALKAHGPPFDRMYLGMVQAGEAGGFLPDVLARLTAHIQQSRETRSSIVLALIYPATLLAVSVISLILLMAFVVPQFESMFANAGTQLPVMTRIVVAASNAFAAYWWVLLLLLLAGLLFLRSMLSSPGGRLRLHRRLLSLPLAGPLIRKAETGRFCRALSALLTNGVPMLRAVHAANMTLNNDHLREGIRQAADRLGAGQGFARPLAEQAIFPRLANQMIHVGEESGGLAGILESIAEVYEAEVRQDLKKVMAFAEPAIILTLGVVIGFVIVSIFVAIASINDLAF